MDRRQVLAAPAVPRFGSIVVVVRVGSGRRFGWGHHRIRAHSRIYARTPIRFHAGGLVTGERPQPAHFEAAPALERVLAEALFIRSDAPDVDEAEAARLCPAVVANVRDAATPRQRQGDHGGPAAASDSISSHLCSPRLSAVSGRAASVIAPQYKSEAIRVAVLGKRHPLPSIPGRRWNDSLVAAVRRRRPLDVHLAGRFGDRHCRRLVEKP